MIVTAHSINSVAATHTSSGGDECSSARVARYARGDDYHDVIGAKLQQLGGWLAGRTGGRRWKATVDTSPLSEKAYAVAAGIGWRGKHSLVVNEHLGSYFMLGCLLTEVLLEPDSPVENQCGSCRRCLDACPAGALVEAGVLNAALCISYHTTTRQGSPAEAPVLDGWLFGCDACQLACPYNAAPGQTTEPRFLPREGVESLTAEEIIGMSQAEFNRRFKGTCMAYHGLDHLRVAAGELPREYNAEKKAGPDGTG